MIPSILFATNPIWKDNVREFCNHYRQDIPNYAGLPAELLLSERMWKGKNGRRQDIPDIIAILGDLPIALRRQYKFVLPSQNAGF